MHRIKQISAAALAAAAPVVAVLAAAPRIRW